jgi:hypothetical protein
MPIISHAPITPHELRAVQKRELDIERFISSHSPPLQAKDIVWLLKGVYEAFQAPEVMAHRPDWLDTVEAEERTHQPAPPTNEKLYPQQQRQQQQAPISRGFEQVEYDGQAFHEDLQTQFGNPTGLRTPAGVQIFDFPGNDFGHGGDMQGYQEEDPLQWDDSIFKEFIDDDAIDPVLTTGTPMTSFGGASGGKPMEMQGYVWPQFDMTT